MVISRASREIFLKSEHPLRKLHHHRNVRFVDRVSRGMVYAQLRCNIFKEGRPMAYDLLVKNGRIIDGSGMPSFHGDVGVSRGKIVELGRLSGAAKRVIDAEGMVIAPGFIDNHCHYDAQVTWDPLCTFSCYNGATTEIIGNCSLAMAPVRANDHEKLMGLLSQVEAIPMDILRAGLKWRWESIPEYMQAVEERLGVNVGMMIGHSAVRLYAMGDASQERAATERELEVMRGVVR